MSREDFELQEAKRQVEIFKREKRETVADALERILARTPNNDLLRKRIKEFSDLLRNDENLDQIEILVNLIKK